MTSNLATQRLAGLDFARFVAFVGMVIVNFKIVMGADQGVGLLHSLTQGLEGRAAATFVVLAGMGLGLAAYRDNLEHTLALTVKRALFLLVIGLLNMLVFDADILHYYAFYFLFGALLLPLNNARLIGAIVAINAVSLVLLLALDYEAGWNFDTLSYQGFWSPTGFVRNLFYNGWHPVLPWLSFLLFGMVLSRLSLGSRSTQWQLLIGGLAAIALAEFTAGQLKPLLFAIDPELAELATTAAVPPTPLYIITGGGVACLVVGLCLLATPLLTRSGILAITAPAGRQTLTLYIAHILLGMGTLEALGLLGGQSIAEALLAAGLFCTLAVIYAWFWARRFKRGPIEFLMRKIAG